MFFIRGKIKNQAGFTINQFNQLYNKSSQINFPMLVKIFISGWR